MIQTAILSRSGARIEEINCDKEGEGEGETVRMRDCWQRCGCLEGKNRDQYSAVLPFDCSVVPLFDCSVVLLFDCSVVLLICQSTDMLP